MYSIRGIRDMANQTDYRINKRAGQTLHITGAACLGNTAVGIGKLAIGLYFLSFFTCASAFYTFGMVAAKSFALAGMIKGVRPDRQYRYYRASGLVLIGASVLYIIYSIRLFINPANTDYSMNMGLAIATFTFTELALNIRGVIIERHNHALLVHAVKMINLASSLICLVLTQAAILSFADEQKAFHPTANGIMGILMGSAASLIGIIMIIRTVRIQKRIQCRATSHGNQWTEAKTVCKMKRKREAQNDSYTRAGR